MTVPRLLRLLLMLLVSLSRSPAEPDWDSLSEPARSIKFKVPARAREHYRRHNEDC